MSEKQALVPRMRFPEFWGTGEWRFIPLSKLAKRCTEKNREGKLTRVLTNSAEYGVVDQRDFFDKDIAVQGNLENYCIVERGDFVYNPRISRMAPVGPISKNTIATGVMSPLYTVFRFKSENNDFYKHYFSSTGWHHYMRQVSSTGARHDRMAVSTDDFNAMPLPVAPGAEEQQKIADCLSSLDNLIAAQTEKIGALKTHKKGLMQQLFPCEGETIPRLRFPEFQDAMEWELKNLGDKDVSNFVKTRVPVNALVLDKYISTENLLPDFGGIKNASKLPPSGSFTSYRPDDILIANIRPYLKKVWVADRSGGASNDVIVVRPMKKVRNSFLASLLKNEIFINYVMLGAKGVKMPRGDVSLMKEYPIALPSPEEQQKIADCLSSLDALIIAQSEKIDALKTHKKGLMQQLFPMVDGE